MGIDKAIKRRNFLKRGSILLASGAVAIPAFASSLSQSKRLLPKARGNMPCMIIDISRCMGCQSCTTACKLENNTVFGEFLTKIEERITKRNGTPYPEFVPVSCIHCKDAPCMDACRHEAITRLDNGIVVTDWSVCKADGACIEACPYGARIMDDRFSGKSDSCDLCQHRIEVGLLPACVEACPSRARIFGYIDRPDGEFSEYIASQELSDPKGNRLSISKARIFYTGGARDGKG